MRTRIKSNSEVILSSMIRRGLRPQDVARETGLDIYQVARVSNADRPIGHKTAGKLVAVFGADAVTISPAAQV